MEVKKTEKMKRFEDLVPFALAIVSVVIIVAIGSLVLTEFDAASYDNPLVGNEAFNATSNPYNYTVQEAGNADFVKLDSATVYDTTSQNTELTATIVDAESGKVEVEGVTDSGDESIDYQYSQETQATTVLEKAVSALQTFGDFFNVVVVIGIAAVIFMLLKVLRGGAGRSGI